MVFLDFSFSRLDLSIHKSLSVCEKYHSWFYSTLKVTENKILLYLVFANVANFIKFTIHRPTICKRPVSRRNMVVVDLYSISPRRDTSMKNCDKFLWKRNEVKIDEKF